MAALSGILLYVGAALLVPLVLWIVLGIAYGTVGAVVGAVITFILLVAGGYLGFRVKGFAFFEAFAAGVQSLLQEDKKEAKKDRVPRPSAHWVGQLAVAVGHQCEIPRCRKDTHLQVHHINPHASGGGNALSNLIVVCPNHHKDCDRRAIGVTQQRAIIRRANRITDTSFKGRWDKYVLKKGQENGDDAWF